MNPAVDFLVEHGPMLLAGTTCLLSCGTLALAAARQPVHRQRTGELTVVAVLLWLLAACVPLPRLDSSQWVRAGTVAASMDLAATHGPAVNSAGVSRELALARPHSDTVAARGNETAVDLEAIVVPNDDRLRMTFRDSSTIAAVHGRPDATANRTNGSGRIAPHSESQPGKVNKARTRATAIEYTTAIEGQRPALPLWLASVYLVGSVGVIVWLLLGRILLLRLRATAQYPEPWLQRLYASISRQQHRRTPRLLVSAKSRHAFSHGVLLPVIVLPTVLCHTKLAPPLRKVLLHELAHVARRDALGRLACNLALPVLWFHPLYWWLRRQTEFAAELLADDRAAAHTSRTAYATDLIRLARAHRHSGSASLGYAGLFLSRTQFYRRMNMLMHRTAPLSPRCSRKWRVASSALALGALVGMVALLGVESKAQDSKPDADAAGEQATAAQEQTPSADLTQKSEAGQTPSVPVAAGTESGRADERHGDIVSLESEQEALNQLIEAATAAATAATEAERAEHRAKLKMHIEELKQRIEAFRRSLEDPDGDYRKSLERLESDLRGVEFNIRDVFSEPLNFEFVELTQQLSAELKKQWQHRLRDVDWESLGKRLQNPETREEAIKELLKALRRPLKSKTRDDESTSDLQRDEATPSESDAEGPTAGIAVRNIKRVPLKAEVRTVKPETRPAATLRLAETAKSLPSLKGDNAHDALALLGRDGPQNDLVSLITAYTKAQEQAEIARAQLERLSRLKETNVVPEQEYEVARIKARFAERRLGLLRTTGEVLRDSAAAEAESAKARFEGVHRLAEKGYVGRQDLAQAESRVRQAEAKLKILEMILNE